MSVPARAVASPQTPKVTVHHPARSVACNLSAHTTRHAAPASHHSSQIFGIASSLGPHPSAESVLGCVASHPLSQLAERPRRCQCSYPCNGRDVVVSAHLRAILARAANAGVRHTHHLDVFSLRAPTASSLGNTNSWQWPSIHSWQWPSIHSWQWPSIHSWQWPSTADGGNRGDGS